ncbi:MAG TPA: hypothetical protein VGG54_22270 [Trebonia sp.]
MSASDLSSIEGLEDKHLRVLARHGVTDLRGLVQADREVIYRATANLRPRPPRDLIARWQEGARSLLAEITPDDWQMVASFVVVFFQRRAGDAWERRVEAERTEVEPERNPSVWAGWETAPICEWMVGQLGQANGAEADGAEPAAGGGTADVAGEVAVGEAGADGSEDAAGAAGVDERPALRIDSAVVTDAPARVSFTVNGAPLETRLWAVARILRDDGPGWNAQDPVAVTGSEHVEFDLSGLPAGEHVVRLLAWAPDATAKPASVQLPAITIPAD